MLLRLLGWYARPFFEAPTDQGGGGVTDGLATVLKPFQDRLAAATDEEKPGIELELERAKSGFFEAQVQVSNVKGWTVAALAKYPKAFPGALVGATEAEIEEAAKASHEHVEAQLAAAATAIPPPAAPPAAPKPSNAAAQQGYGTPTGSGGRPPANKDIQEIDRIHDGLREAFPRNGRGQKGALGSAKIKPGDDLKIAGLRLDPEFDKLEKNYAGRSGWNPAGAGAR